MTTKYCKDCELCITWQGRTRCGKGEWGYIYIDKNDPACSEYESFETESET